FSSQHQDLSLEVARRGMARCASKIMNLRVAQNRWRGAPLNQETPTYSLEVARRAGWFGAARR
ncbi:hypothetical protein A2U01_0110584, partial [Trifolium medium]|nr:hypothetical protein [Trifolium medium]